MCTLLCTYIHELCKIIHKIFSSSFRREIFFSSFRREIFFSSFRREIFFSSFRCRTNSHLGAKQGILAVRHGNLTAGHDILAADNDNLAVEHGNLAAERTIIGWQITSVRCLGNVLHRTNDYS
jgi:hypothetical protein